MGKEKPKKNGCKHMQQSSPILTSQSHVTSSCKRSESFGASKVSALKHVENVEIYILKKMSKNNSCNQVAFCFPNSIVSTSICLSFARIISSLEKT